jgi:hypothetical protein
MSTVATAKQALTAAIDSALKTMGDLTNTIVAAAPQSDAKDNVLTSVRNLGTKLGAAVPIDPLATAPVPVALTGTVSSAGPLTGGRRRSMHKKLKKGRKSRKNKSM